MPATASSPKERKLDGGGAGNDNLAEALEQIEAVQNEIDDLNEKASEEILKVEQKYNKLRRPHYLKRNDITVKIPNFWAQSIMNHPMLSTLVDTEEEECLKHLSKIDVEEFADIKSGFKLTFTFTENEFFTNTELVKEFNLSTTSGEQESKSTTIQWKEGKNFVKKSGGKKSNGADVRKRSANQHGFFHWFTEESDPIDDEYAELIKDDIWPNPLHYYLSTDLDYSEQEKLGGLTDEDDEEESLGEEDSDLEEDGEGEEDDDEDPEDLDEDSKQG